MKVQLQGYHLTRWRITNLGAVITRNAAVVFMPLGTIITSATNEANNDIAWSECDYIRMDVNIITNGMAGASVFQVRATAADLGNALSIGIGATGQFSSTEGNSHIDENEMCGMESDTTGSGAAETINVRAVGLVFQS